MGMGESNLWPAVVTAPAGKSGPITDAAGNVIFGFNSTGGTGGNGLATIGKRDAALGLIGPPYDQIVYSAAQHSMVAYQADGVSNNASLLIGATGFTFGILGGSMTFGGAGHLTISGIVDCAGLIVNGNNILSNVGSAIPDATGTLANAVTTINTLLAELRTMGLISP